MKKITGTLFNKLICATFSIVISSLLFVGCTTENEEIESELGTLNESFATPEVGNVYTIQNSASGRTLDIQGGSNSNGANLQIWGTNTSTTSTHRHWEIISVDGTYVRLRGVDSGKTLEVAGGSNSNGANVQQWAFQGTTHQQWEIISVNNGLFRLKNRDSGKSLRAAGTSNGGNVDQWNYDGSENQKWFFTQIGSSSEEEDDDDDSNEEEDDSSGEFISTNDGTFNLNDFQIESSSHLSSSTSTSTTSWSYDDDEILGTEWYNLSGNDYYLKSASNDGKRTEFKEYSGIESTLNNKVLKYEASIDDIPENGVTIAQVHNRYVGSSARSNRPFLRVYIEDGRIYVKATTNDLTNSSGTYSTETGPTYSENSRLKVQLTLSGGSVNVKVQTTSGVLDANFTPNTSVSNWNNYDDKFYLKAGVYTEGNDTEPIIRFYSFEK